MQGRRGRTCIMNNALIQLMVLCPVAFTHLGL